MSMLWPVESKIDPPGFHYQEEAIRVLREKAEHRFCHLQKRRLVRFAAVKEVGKVAVANQRSHSFVRLIGQGL